MGNNDPLGPMQTFEEQEEDARFSRGQIESITLPAGWVSGEEKLRTEAVHSYKEYHPAESPDAMICFFYRGRRAGEESSKNFRDILAKPPHDLTESESESIGQILRDKRDPEDFEMTSCRTEDVNGKRVLVVEGRYHAIQEEALAMFIDADNSSYGSAVQEIYFQAPSADFHRYLKVVEGSFRSIEWTS